MRPLLWTVLALGASVGASALGRGGVELLGGAATGLRFEKTVLDFGTVYASETVEGEFAFSNPTKEPIRIDDVAFACGCLEAVPSARWIGPGDRGTVRAKLATHGRFGPQSVHIRVKTDDGTALLKLRGNIRAVVRAKPQRLFLGEVEPGVPIGREIGIDVLEPIDGLELDAEALDAELDGRTIKATVTPKAEVGTTIGGVELRYRHAGRELETWIPIAWTVPAPLILDPPELRLGGGRATLKARPRWPGRVKLVDVDTGSLPLEVTRSGDELTVVLTGEKWEIPAGARLRLVVEPESLGPVEVPVLP